MTSKYTTIQGDMWDSIAKAQMGKEIYCSTLMAANPDHRNITIFSAGIVLTIPEVTIEISTDNLPPWK